MLEKILNFITPGPLDERFGFGARVFCSWISLGLGLGLVNLLIYIALGLGTTLSLETVAAGFIGGSLLSCVYGLIGVGIDSIRGRRVEYPGWYWWVFPIATFLFVCLWLTFGLFGVFLALAGIKLPKLPDFDPKPSNIDPDEFRRELENMKVEDLLKDFGKKLEQIDNQSQLNPEEKKVVKKIKQFDSSKYKHRLRELLTDDELEELILLLLKLLGVEVR
jgi:hypothetical protein